MRAEFTATGTHQIWTADIIYLPNRRLGLRSRSGATWREHRRWASERALVESGQVSLIAARLKPPFQQVSDQLEEVAVALVAITHPALMLRSDRTCPPDSTRDTDHASAGMEWSVTRRKACPQRQ